MHDDDIDFFGPDGKPIEDFDYTEHLPWCGPMRPYAYRWATDESALLPDMRKMNCYKCPSLNCTTALVPWMELDLYCWVNGTEVSNDTTSSKLVHVVPFIMVSKLIRKLSQWFQRAQRVGPDHDEKCWLPAKMIAPNPAPPSFFDVARSESSPQFYHTYMSTLTQRSNAWVRWSLPGMGVGLGYSFAMISNTTGK
jgi:hypothetical protein